jgi:hypothetical protein
MCECVCVRMCAEVLVLLIVWTKWRHAGPKMADFRALLSAELPESIVELSKDVEDFAKQFPTVGFEKSAMRYQD